MCREASNPANVVRRSVYSSVRLLARSLFQQCGWLPAAYRQHFI